MDEVAARFKGVGFGNGETGAGDWLGDAETLGETASKGGFAGANIADKFDNDWEFEFLGEICAKSQHFLLRIDVHCIIIT